MEELVQVLNEIKKILQTNVEPPYLTVITGIIPLILTGISVFSAIIQYKQSVKLQKEIHNRDARMQREENVLQIYNAFFNAQGVVSMGNQNLAGTFANPDGLNRWLTDLGNASTAICQATNQVNLFFRKSDAEFVMMLENCRDKFIEFQKDIWEYVNSGKAQSDYNNAWNIIGPQMGNVVWNTLSLWQNPQLFKQFIQLCDTDDVKRLKKQGDDFLACLSYEKFDCYFEKHLNFDKLL